MRYKNIVIYKANIFIKLVSAFYFIRIDELFGDSNPSAGQVSWILFTYELLLNDCDLFVWISTCFKALENETRKHRSAQQSLHNFAHN
jgi:hypothetical protein